MCEKRGKRKYEVFGFGSEYGSGFTFLVWNLESGLRVNGLGLGLSGSAISFCNLLSAISFCFLLSGVGHALGLGHLF